MILTRDKGHGDFEIHSYEPGVFKINEKFYTESLLLGRHLLAGWPMKNISELTLTSLKPLLAHQPDLILLGTGPSLIFPDHALLHFFYQQQVGFEVMDTLAACKTFNVLMSEDRNVIALLLIE